MSWSRHTCVGDGRIAVREQHILLYFPFCANSHGNMALLVLPISLEKKQLSIDLYFDMQNAHGGV